MKFSARNCPVWRLGLWLALCLLGTVTESVWAECSTFARSTPDSQLLDNADGTVTDLATGLMWQRCSHGQASDESCSGVASDFSWQAALQAAESLNASAGLAGYTDWRVPNLNELRSLVEEACFDPAINDIRFPNTEQSSYWTSSPNAYVPDCSWFVSFDEGYASFNYRDHGMHLRLVRDLPEAP